LLSTAFARPQRWPGALLRSFINAVMLAANVGVEIRANSAYLIPYGKECQLVIDYRGLIDIARARGEPFTRQYFTARAKILIWSTRTRGRV